MSVLSADRELVGRELEGKVALVTGAARGVGAATVAWLHARGARVLATDLRPEVDDLATRFNRVAPWSATCPERTPRCGRWPRRSIGSAAWTSWSATLVDR
ncbi:hypothetical protein [Amycolatopsis anabasis]|uniref:hypothetical protein n=1 Tax=Amycolatopsis anabasis TaxID=1840409 RepID=UPI003CCE3E85